MRLRAFTALRALLWMAIALLAPAVAEAQPTISSVTTSAETVGHFERLEVTVRATAQFDNAFDDRQVTVAALLTSPGGTTITAPGFYFQDFSLDASTGQTTPRGNPVWKIRFAPTETGMWSFVVRCTDATGSTTSPAQSFACAESTSRGFVRRAGARYLKFDDGTPYFAIGENMGWGEGNQIVDFRRWIDRLSASGGNYIRVWMASWSFAVEWQDTGLGDYTARQRQAFLLDEVIDYAASKGVYVQLCLNNHGQYSANTNPEWAQNPYNAGNGGPCDEPADFFTDATARDLLKRRLRYVVDRWGASTNVLAWELFNEVNLTDEFEETRPANAAWHEEMAAYLKALDVNRHLVTTSYADPRFEPDVWSSPNVDYTQTHVYLVTADPQSVHTALVRRYLNDFAKPTLVGEYGFPDPTLSNTNDPTGVDFHNSVWASALSGAMGTSMTWWWDSYVDPRNLYRHLDGLSTFVTRTGHGGEDAVPIAPVCSTTVRSELAVAPGFTAFDRAPSNRFVVSADGVVTPGPVDLGVFLFGPRYHPELVNPPTFEVDYARAGTFEVATGSQSGESPTIEIWLDGRKLLDRPAAVNMTYSIDVPAGRHEIFVDNKGTDWIVIADFRFDPYVPLVRSYALGGADGVVGWLQNRAYNWQVVKRSGAPDPVSGATIGLSGLGDGTYRVEWRSTTDGSSLAASSVVATTGGALTLAAPPVRWDYTYEVRRLAPGSDATAPVVSEVMLSKKKVKRATDPTVRVTWSADDDTSVASYDVQFAADGVSFVTVVASLPGSSTETTWTVPASVPKAKSGAVRVVAYDGAGNAGFSSAVGLKIK